MSLELDITEIKRMVEAVPKKKGLFKAATPEQIAGRGEAPTFDNPQLEEYYQSFLDDGMASETAKGWVRNVADNGFSDPMMQKQYMDMVMDGEFYKNAREKVIKAHKEYFGDSADFNGIPSESKGAYDSRARASVNRNDARLERRNG